VTQTKRANGLLERHVDSFVCSGAAQLTPDSSPGVTNDSNTLPGWGCSVILILGLWPADDCQHS
jgi:hypothetical protein